jgi:mono/diheme cytochrome c family protein
MKKVLKWIGIVLLVLAVIIVAAMFMFRSKYQGMAKERYEVNVPNVAILTDSASMVRGESLANSMCTGCHGGDLAGKDFFNDPTVGIIYSANITPGGRPKTYSDADYIRAIRYGVKPDGSGMFVMPVTEMNQMSDADLGALIGYLKSMPASDKPTPANDLTFLSEVMAGAGMFGTLYNCTLLDLQDASVRTAPEFGETLAFGEYTLKIHGCNACHGDELNGFKSPDPVSPPGANLTPAGNLGKWSYEQFAETLWTGKTPEGKVLDPKFMPWEAYRLMTDTEKKALFMYLQSVPAKEDAPELAKYKAKS